VSLVQRLLAEELRYAICQYRNQVPLQNSHVLSAFELIKFTSPTLPHFKIVLAIVGGTWHIRARNKSN